MDIFCKIIKKELPSKIIYEDDLVIAFEDAFPVNPGHFLVVPKKHSTNLKDIEEKDFLYTAKKANELAKKRIKKMNVNGFRFQINNEKESKQVIFHTHIHIIPSLK